MKNSKEIKEMRERGGKYMLHSMAWCYVPSTINASLVPSVINYYTPAIIGKMDEIFCSNT